MKWLIFGAVYVAVAALPQLCFAQDITQPPPGTLSADDHALYCVYANKLYSQGAVVCLTKAGSATDPVQAYECTSTQPPRWAVSTAKITCSGAILK
jgi:hypothetical protein